MNSDNAERIGQISDRLDSLVHGLLIPMSPELHVSMLKEILPELRDELREVFIQETGEDPWADHPEENDHG